MIVSRDLYELAIQRLNELDVSIPHYPRDRKTMPDWLQEEVRHWEQVIWDYESQQHRGRAIPSNSA